MENEFGWWLQCLRDDRPRLQPLGNNVYDSTSGADFWTKPGLRELDEGDWIRRNWTGEWVETKQSKARLTLCQLALESGAPILELAAGAGGGNLAPLLQLAPETRLIVNDLESRVLTRWAKFLHGHRLGRNVVFVACDACDLPLADQRLGAISSIGGLGSLCGSDTALLAECARTLKADGWLLIGEMVLTPDSLLGLQEELLTNWSALHWLLGRAGSRLQQAGFTVIHHWVEGGRLLDGERDGLAAEAASHGLQLAVEYHYFAAKKTAAI